MEQQIKGLKEIKIAVLGGLKMPPKLESEIFLCKT